MPRLTLAHPKGRGVTGQGGRVGLERACKWMEEEVKEDGEGEAVERRREQSSNQTPADDQSQQTLWSQTVRTPWFSLVPVGVVWLVCQQEALLHPSLSLLDVGWRLLLMCLLWVVLGGCFHALKRRLQPGWIQFKGESPQRRQQDVVAVNRNYQYSWRSQSRSPGLHVPLSLALADSLLLCVLQEPLSDPSVAHIQSLLSRLESVAHTLQKADTGSEVSLEEVDQGSILTDKLKLLHAYLQQRTGSLQTLLQVQGDFEASVKDMLQGLNGLWAQLEELHTGVTLTKQGSQGQVAVASAQTHAETLFAVLGDYRNRLQSCQAHLKNSTQLLQELTWSHTHISHSVSSSSESVWPELLLQSNIEQFDTVQECFFSVEQQTSSFRAHLEGLGKGNQEGQAGPLARVNGPHSCSVPPQTSLHAHSGRTGDVSLEQSNSTSGSSVDGDTDTKTESDSPLSLCERSALQVSSTFGRLRLSGRRK